MKTGKGKRIALFAVCAGAVIAIILCLIIGGKNMNIFKKEFTVGKDIAFEDVNEFYYTKASSTNPPDFLRYRIYRDGGHLMFYCEKREGNHWPLTENDITEKNTKELKSEEWAELTEYLNGGTVKKRSQSTESGDDGPFMYIYWSEDKSEYQEFSFASYEKQEAFRQLCEKLSKEM